MATTAATSLLGLALPVTGELSGTWGDTVNVSITALLDTAVAGTTTLSSDADVTLTTTTLTANEARQAIILWTAGGTATRTITVPARSKSYIVINKTSSSQSIKIVGAGPTTGVTIVAGTAALVVWNGVDFVTASVTSTTGVLPVANGGTGLTSGTSGGVLAYTATGTLASSTALAASALVIGGGAGAAPSTTTTGTGVVTALGVNIGTAGAFVVNGGALGTPASGTATNLTGLPLTTGVTGTLPVANGGTGLTAGTSGGVLAYTASGTLASSSALAANALVIGGGAGVAPSTTTTGTGVLTFLGTPSSANLAAAVTDETGSGALVFGTSPTFTTSVIGGATMAVFNTTSTTVNAFGAATTLNVGAATGTLTVANTTLAAKAITASTTLGVTGVSTLTAGAVIQGLTVGLGAGADQYNTAVGVSALAANTAGGSQNVAVGWNALLGNTTGTNNTAIGMQSLKTTTTGSNNSAIGLRSLQLNTTGSYNTGLGNETLYSNTTASNNTAVGYQAGYSNTTGTGHTALGYQAGYSHTTAVRNTLVGIVTGYGLTTGSGNTFIGTPGLGNAAGCGFAMTTGNDNTIIGGYTGNQGGLDIRTASNYIVLSDGAGNPRAYWNGAAATFNGGLAVTGALSATGTLSGGTSGTAYSFSGSAPATSLTLNSSGNLGIGTTSTLNYNAGGTYKNLSIDGGATTDARAEISLAGGGGGANYNLGRINFGLSSNTTNAAAGINGYSSAAGASTGGILVFLTASDISSGAYSERARIDSGGNLTISNGNLVIGTSGKGIDFSITSSGSGTMTSELLADYEEGTWTPSQGSNLTVVGTFSSSGTYTKIGRLVIARGVLTGSTSVALAGTPAILCANLPFTVGGTCIGGAVDNNASQGISVFSSGTSVYGSSSITATPQINFNSIYFV